MATIERRVAFLVEVTPGVWEFHVQRGSLNSIDPIDRVLDHPHFEDLVNPDSIHISGGTVGSLTERVVELPAGQLLIHPESGGGAIAAGNVVVGATLGFTKGATFPAVFASDGINDAHQRHWYTGGGMEEFFFYDRSRSAWLSERVITTIFCSSSGLIPGAPMSIPQSGQGQQNVYGYQSTDELMLVQSTFSTKVATGGTIHIDVYSANVLKYNWNVGAATFAQSNDIAVVFPASEVQTITHHVSSFLGPVWIHLNYRRHFVS